MTEDTSAAGVPLWRRSVLFFRRLYDWTLSWAETPYGVPALGAIAFAESSFFPVPPDVLLIALALGRPRRAFWFAAVCALGSVAGGVAGWFIGWGLWEVVGGFCFAYLPGFTPENFARVQKAYRDNAFLAVFGAAFTPIPYKVFTVAGGVFRIPLATLVLASAVGRSLRFFLVAALFYFFGPPMKRLIDRYFEWFALAFGVLLVAGFAAIKWAN